MPDENGGARFPRSPVFAIAYAMWLFVVVVASGKRSTVPRTPHETAAVLARLGRSLRHTRRLGVA